MTKIAPTAVIDETAQIGENVTIGSGSVIGANVVIGNDCEIKSNAIIMDNTIMGTGNRIFSNTVIGEEPQIFNLPNPDTKLIIGDNNTFRECVTINRGSPDGGGKTVIGNNNYFMIGAHVGHDCEVDDNVMLGNYFQVAGHCKLENNSWLSALGGIHQFCTIGQYAYVGGLGGITHDIPPFTRSSGSYPCVVRGINLVGIKRAGFSNESMHALNSLYKKLYIRKEHAIEIQVKELLEQGGHDENVQYFLEFLSRSFQHRMGRYREQYRH